PAAGDRRAQRLAGHLARHVLVVASRRGTERLAAALPLRRADRALARAAGALLLPGLLAAARDLAPALRVVGADATIGELAHDGLMQHGQVHGVEHVGLELEAARLLALRVDHLEVRHRYFFPAAGAGVTFFVFTLLRSITSEPLAPGTAPRTSTRFCSGSTRTTLMLSTVRRSPPMRPGSLWPGHTREGSDDAPIEPGARWNIEPWLASPPFQLWRFTPPWKPLPFDTPTTSTTSPAVKRSAPMLCPIV